MTKEKINKQDNPMRNIAIEKIVLSGRGVDNELEKSFRLLKKITKKNPTKKITEKRIPGFGVRPKMQVGCLVTLRGKEASDLLKRLLASIDNQLKKKQVTENHFSFGIPEYIEIPGEEYDREIGIIGLGVTIVFVRKGKRVIRKKIKKGRLPARQKISKEEIIKFMQQHFKTQFK
ncbi:MAG: 50S ribosomal protein L5 [Candidatus Pacearchaeota archaeon]|jgi:large subunit ribosomal protein L5